jgi:hypothetical protein
VALQRFELEWVQRWLLRAGCPNLPFSDLSFRVVRYTEIKFGKSKLFGKTDIRL